MNYFPHFWSSPDYGQTERDAYEPTLQLAQVGSIRAIPFKKSWGGGSGNAW